MIIVIAASRLRGKVGVMNERTNTTAPQHESTYALLVRSEEKSRSVFEVVIYPLLILGPLIAIWQFSHQPVNIPATGLKGACHVALEASAQSDVCRGEVDTVHGRRHQQIKG